MKSDLALSLSGGRHSTYSFFTFAQGDPSHLAWPHSILCGNEKHIGGCPSKLETKCWTARSPHLPQKYHLQKILAKTSLCSRRKTVWAKQKEISYFSHCRQRNMFSLCFTVASGGQRYQLYETPKKWNSFHRPSRDSTKAQRHFHCSYTLHLTPRCKEQIQVTMTGQWGKSKDMRAKSSYPDETFHWKLGLFSKKKGPSRQLQLNMLEKHGFEVHSITYKITNNNTKFKKH